MFILLSVSKVTYRADATRAGKRVDEVLPMLKTLDQDDSREWIQCMNEAVVYACIEMIEEDEDDHQAPGTTIDPTSKKTYASSGGTTSNEYATMSDETLLNHITNDHNKD